MSACNEHERQLLAGVCAHPETWERVHSLLPKPDQHDGFLVFAWEVAEHVHRRGARLDLMVLVEQFFEQKRQKGLVVNPDEEGAFTQISSDLSWFVDSRSVIDKAQRVATARANRAAKVMLGHCQDRLAHDPLADPHEFLNALQEKLRATYPRRLEIPIANAAEGTRLALESTKPATIPTGFAGIDDQIGGLPIGLLTLLGARTGVGKTTFLIALARNQIFAKAAQPFAASTPRLEVNATASPYVLLVSCENTAAMIWERLACDMLDLESDDMRTHRAEIVDTAPLAPRSQPYIDALAQHGRFAVIDEADMGNISITTIRASIEAWADKVTVKDPDATMLVMVDYLQRIDPTEKQAKEARHRQIELAAKSLATLAKTRGIALVTTEQLNDSPDNAEPVRGDSRESKGANNEAGLILLLHSWSAAQRAALESKHGLGSPQARCMSLLCGKARGARDGWRAVLDFDGSHYRVTDAANSTNYLLDPRITKVAVSGAKRK